MAKVSVLLDEQRDADILRWLETQPNHSAAFRQAARAQIQALTAPLDAATLRRVLREELAGLQAAQAKNATPPTASDADATAAQRLDEMF